MRTLIIGSFAVAALAAAASAQTPARSSDQPTMSVDGRLRTEIFLIRTLFGSINAPEADSFKVGARAVPAGTEYHGTMAVARGDLQVRGRITGDAIALHGDVIVYPGGFVAGNAVAIDGRVRMAGGVVEGDVRSIRGVAGSLLARTGGRTAAAAPVSAWTAVKMVLGWFAVLVAIGIGVLLFAESNLDGVVRTLDTEFARSFWVGILAQVAVIPALLVLLLALAVSLIGILLIPFAVVAYVTALAGLCTLGFLAVSRFTGRAFFGGVHETRAVHLRSLVVGLAAYLGLWFIAAAFVWHPLAGSILRAVALAGTWVGLTFGLGATLLSRAGTQRESARAGAARPPDDLAWQTPTPVTGVVAARRPVVTAREG